MVKAKFICKKCGRKFTVEIFEEGEAQEKRFSGSLVRCPHCQSTAVERY